VLGVSAAATPEELRHAYLNCAREAHPDRHIDASGAERADAERRMQQINEAWRVLGNPRRRRRYDLERAPQERFVSRSDGTMPADNLFDNDPLEEIDTTTRLIRGLPWMILVFVMFAIFVFTAYAVTGGASTKPTPNAGSCVTIASGPEVVSAPCDASNARRVIAIVQSSQPCPARSERLVPVSGALVYCLEV
jgi:hypothetical protein